MARLKPPKVERFSLTYYTLYHLPHKSYIKQELKTREACDHETFLRAYKTYKVVLDRTNTVRDRCHYQYGTYYL